MRTLQVVTHPEATHVVDRLVGGWYDADLTTKGVAHAELIADELVKRRTGATAVFTSDLRRCLRIAELIAGRLGATAILDAELREQSYGAAEGLPLGTFPYSPPPESADRLRHHDGVHGSETRLDLATRIYAAVDRVLGSGADQAVVVTHGGGRWS